jgi:hypothetical protein
MSEANDIDDFVGQDPYYLWRDLPYDTRLPRDVVAAGLAKWLEGQLQWIWDQQTEIKTPWYLSRRKALRAWCLDEAALRLSAKGRDSYSAAEFAEIHFIEALHENKLAALRDSFWDGLFQNKKSIGDLAFFEHLSILIDQPPQPFHQGKRLFCLLWDRACIPLEYWKYSAAVLYLQDVLGRLDRHALAPDEVTLRQWVHRLGLRPFRPAVITGYTKGKSISRHGFNLEAFILARIPPPSLEDFVT